MKVLNYYHGVTYSDTVIYVGRPSSWGNPFRAGEWGTVSREEAIRLFRVYAQERLKFDPEWLSPLKGAEALVCYCTPKPCHADVLVELLSEH